MGHMTDERQARSALAREERRLRMALIAGAVLFALEAAIYVPDVFRGPAATRPYAINSVAKDVLFCVLTAAAAADLRRRGRLISLVILGHVVIVTLLLAAVLTGNTGFDFPPPRWLASLAPVVDVGQGSRAVVWLVGAAAATAGLAWLLHEAVRVRHDLRYLWPAEHATVTAVAEAILTAPQVPAVEIATSVDHYWASLDIGYKRRLRLALWVVCLLPVIYARPPLPWMELEARRRFIRRRFVHDVATRSDLSVIRSTVQSTFRFAMQLVYMGYYRDPRSYPATGYVPFSQRSSSPPVPVPATRAADARSAARAPPARRRGDRRQRRRRFDRRPRARPGRPRRV